MRLNDFNTNHPIFLKSVFFCPKNETALEGLESNDKQDTFFESFEELHLNSKNDLCNALTVNVHTNEIPLCFQKPPIKENTQQTLADYLFYSFSDGTILNLHQILFHPYAKIVPKKILPLLSNIRPGLKTNQWISLCDRCSFSTSEEKRLEELTIFSILMNIALFIDPADHTQPLKFYIYLVKKKQCIELLSVRIQNHHAPFWRLSCTNEKEFLPEGVMYFHLQLPEATHPLEKKTYLAFEINKKDKILQFHSLKYQVALIQQILPAFDYKTNFLLKKNKHILDITKKINTSLQKNGFLPIMQHSALQIPEKKAEFCVWIENSLSFSVSQKLEGYPFQAFNFPHFIVDLIEGIRGGILGFLESQDPNFEFIDRKGPRREHDIRFLRHGGFFAILIITYFHEMDNFDESSLLSKFYKKASHLLVELERKAGFVNIEPETPLENLCSTFALDLLKKCIHTIIHILHSPSIDAFSPAGPLIIEGFYKKCFALFATLTELNLIHLDRESLTRPKIPLLSHFYTSIEDFYLVILPKDNQKYPIARYQLHGSKIKTVSFLQALMRLIPQGFSVKHHSLDVIPIRSEDIHSKFHLIEPSLPPENTKNIGHIDWFELHPQFFFNGIEMDPHHLRSLSQDGILEFDGKLYLIDSKNLPTLHRLEKFWSKIQESVITIEKDGKKKFLTKLPRSQTLELLALQSIGVQINGGPRWKKILNFYQQLNQPRSVPDTPPTIQADLKPYQRIGIQWLLDLFELGLGAILADDMGLGKTIQTLSFLEILRLRKEMMHTVIIVPTSLTYNWIAEAERFTPEIPICIFQSKSKEKIEKFLAQSPQAVLVVTYGLFTEHEEFFIQHHWNIVIFDEAQNLKNLTAKRTAVARKVNAFFKICLTGTPLENHLGEFYSLIDLVVSGSLGDIGPFREKFIYPDKLNPEDIKFLKLKTKPLVLRRTKSAILSELPPKIESTIKLPFEQKQEKIYRDIALSWNEKVKNSILQNQDSKTQILMLTALLRLRQVCSDPASIPNVKYTQTPPKLNVLLEALCEITESHESALVFTQFLHTFDRIRKELLAHNIPIFSLHGGTSRVERERILRSFQEYPKGAVLLMTLKTGGVGLNLVKASYVFHLEPWWNPAVENQATDRAHRIGQKKPVQVYRYLMKESVEEKIELLKDRKTARFNALFSSTEEDIALDTGGVLLSQSDFEYLLS